MTSTNRAFIDAYRASTTTENSEPAAAPESTSGLFRLGSAGSRSVKRPLSSLRGESEVVQGNQFAVTPPTWPVICQQLLAAAAEQYDAVLRKLPTDSHTGMVMGVVGAAPGSGCTTTAICFALRSAALGYSTALVDADLTNPELSRLVGIERYESWEQRLQVGPSVMSAIVPAVDVGVDLLLARSVTACDLDAADRFSISLAAGALRRNYQRVIVDLGRPAEGENGKLAVDLTAAMGVDRLIAVSSPRSDSQQLNAALSALKANGLDVAGLVEAA